MKVHHLNCGTLCPLVSPSGLSLLPATTPSAICHCLLIETPRAGLVLVDTGLGLQDVESRARDAPRLWRSFLRPRLEATETAARQVERLGYSRRDVRHIIVTHLDLDHAGGLPDFPDAKVHVFQDEFDATFRRPPRRGVQRTVARHFRHQPRWQTHTLDGETWEGFGCVQPLADTDDSLLLVPLVGHSLGHCGVAITGGERTLLHAGDAYVARAEIHGEITQASVRLASAFQLLVDDDTERRLANQARLRELARRSGPRLRIFCSHDAAEI
jgi:glyoxylase-like metal-dependent hydrolase (beta-lactamase superfamily II)